MDNSVESTPDRAQRQKELDELRKKELAKNRREKFEYGTMPWSPTVQLPLPMHTHMESERPTNSPQIYTPSRRELDYRFPPEDEAEFVSRQDMEEGVVFFEEREDDACRESCNEEFKYPYVYARKQRDDEESTSSTMKDEAEVESCQDMEEGVVFFEEREDDACRESYNEEFKYPYVYTRKRRDDEASTIEDIADVESSQDREEGVVFYEEREDDEASTMEDEAEVESRQDMEEGVVFFEEREDEAYRESYNEEFKYPYVYTRKRRDDEASTSSTISSLTLLDPMFIKADEQLRFMKELAEKQASPATNFLLDVVEEEEIIFYTSRRNESSQDEHEIDENYFENVSLSSDDDHRKKLSEVEPKSKQLPVNHHFIYQRHRNLFVRGWNRVAHPMWKYVHDKEEQEIESPWEIPLVCKPKRGKTWSKVDKTAVSDPWRWCLLLIAVVMLLSIGVTGVILLVVAAGPVSKDAKPSSDGFDESMEASSRFETLLHMFEPLVGLQFLKDPAFPQHKALEWLANKDPAHHDLSHTSGSVLLQRYVIVLLYFTTKGPEWKEQYNFLSGASVCQWNDLIGTSNSMHISERGIICDERGLVIEIRLGDNNLDGVLPWEVASLENLQVLCLPGNHLIGPLPTQIGALNNLQYMDLVSNKLGGAIPTEIGRLQSLRHIDIESNRIQSVIPTEIGDLTNLEVFSADYNMLYGSLPSSVGLLSNLEYLSVAANDLEGQVPSELGALSSLQHLNIRSNGFRGNLDSHFCDKNYQYFWADCRGSTQQVTCSCCTQCCDGKACCNKTECCALDGESNCEHNLLAESYIPGV